MPELPNLDGVTWREALNAGSAYLLAHGRLASVQDAAEGAEAMSEARYLLQHCLGKTNLELILTPVATLNSDQARTYAGLLARRGVREPVSRIIGKREFYGRDFAISPATLDPRADSETIIDAALTRVATAGKGIRILDIGTGSGCLLLTLLAELPEAVGVGVDPSAEALKMAAANAERLGVANRVRWARGRFSEVAAGLGPQFNLIVSNPPYIARGEIASLERDVRDFDPHLALDGGADGLDIYREIACGLSKVASPGWVLFEIGQSQSAQLIEIMSFISPAGASGTAEVLLDMAGKPRCVVFEVRHSLSPI